MVPGKVKYQPPVVKRRRKRKQAAKKMNKCRKPVYPVHSSVTVCSTCSLALTSMK